MKRINLVNVLAIVNTCTAENPIAPALSYVQFTGTEVRAFNGVQAISTPFETEFPFIVQGKFLETFLRSLTSDEINLELKAEYLNVTSGRMKIQLDILDADSFLYIKDKDEEEKVFNLAPDFFRGLEECLSFASTEQVKESQNGLYLKGTTIFSTDGQRIAKSLNGTIEECSLFLPEKFCSILLKLKKGKKADGVLLVDTTTICYYDGEIILHTARPEIELLDFNLFDKYQQTADKYFTISEEMKAILNRANLVFGTETKKEIKVLLVDDEWRITADSAAFKYVEIIATGVIPPDETEVSFNLTTLLNSLKCAEKMAWFMDDFSSFLLLKNQEDDFSAVVSAI